jgi:hypothetical protein
VPLTQSSYFVDKSSGLSQLMAKLDAVGIPLKSRDSSCKCLSLPAGGGEGGFPRDRETPGGFSVLWNMTGTHVTKVPPELPCN